MSPTYLAAAHLLRTVDVLASRAWRSDRRDERGEGVISAAIAVLVMAFLGVGMYFAFRSTLGKAQTKTDQQVECIGADTAAAGCGGQPAP